MKSISNFSNGGGGRTSTDIDCISDLAKCDNSGGINPQSESEIVVAPNRDNVRENIQQINSAYWKVWRSTRHFGDLGDNERSFLNTIWCYRHKPLTEKQQKWLDDILHRCEPKNRKDPV